jgi:peptide/nickel transport system substrate-binding protein
MRRLAPLLMLFALLSAALPARAAGKDELVIGLSQFPSTFHPSIDAMAAKSYILNMTTRPITTYDKDWKLICMLCTELPTIENGLAVPEKTPEGKDGIAVTYTLQSEARWGDGIPVSTKDILFSWQAGRHPQSGYGDTETFRSIYKVDVKDEKTFTLHFDKLTYEYNAINSLEVLPAHLEESKFADAVAYKTRTTYDTDTTNKGLYFGPYRIVDVVSGSHVTLEPNPTWYGKKPFFKNITVRAIENTAALEANLLSGGIDMIAGELGLTIDQGLALEKRQGNRFDFVYKPGLIYEHIDLNLDNPILKDQRVRKALLYALDRETLAKELFGGRQPVADTFVNPLDWVFDKDVLHYPYDPKKAAELLDAAGWKTLRAGVRVNDKGEKLSFELMSTAGNRSRELVEQVLQNQWKKSGIEIRIRNQPARVFFGETMTQRKYEAMGMFAWVSSPESGPRTQLHSTAIPTPENNFAGQNYTNYRKPEMDELIDAMEVELDRDKRALMWKRIQHIYADELPVLPLYFRADIHVWPKWLAGIEPTGHQYYSSLWVENWHSRP